MKKLFKWCMNTDLWLITAQSLTIISLFITMFSHLSFSLQRELKLLGALCFALLFVLLIRYRLYKHISTWLLILFLTWTFIGGITEHVSLIRIFGNSTQRSWYICLLFLSTAYISEKENRNRWFTIVSALYSLLTAIVFALSFVNITLIEINPGYKASEHLGSWLSGRLSVFGGPNSSGPVATLLILISVILIYQNRRTKLRIPFRIIFGISCAIGIAALSLTRCRSAMLSVSAGLGLFAFIIVWDWQINTNGNTRSRLKSFFISFAAFTAVAVMVFILTLVPKYAYDSALSAYARNNKSINIDKLESELQVYDLSYSLGNLTDRTLIWSAVFRMINEHPDRWIFGLKAPNINNNVIYNVYENRPEITIYSAHNGYLEVLFAFGIPGAGIILIVLIIWIITSIRCIFSDTVSTGHKVLTTICLAVALNALTESFLFPYSILYPYSIFFFTAIGSIQAIMNTNETTKKKTILKIAALAVAFVLIVLLSLFAYSKAKAARKLPESKISAQDPADFVKLNDAVSEAMMSPGYWLDMKRNAGTDTDSPLLTFDQILEYNQYNRRMITGMDNAFSLYEIGDQFYAKMAKKLANGTLFKPEDNVTYLLNGVPVDESYWDGLKENAAIEDIVQRINVRFGFSVVRSVLKKAPTDDCVFEENGSLYCDVLAHSDLTPFMPVAVLHESQDGEWYYVLTECCGGWIRKTDVALCSSREEWLERMNPDNFIVVTGRELRLPVDPYDHVLSELSVPMGTVLPIVSIAEAPESIKDRVSYGNYICRLLTRSSEGLAEDAYVLIPAGSDVHLGYLEYTEHNVCELMFKHLGTEFGWAGSNNSVNSAGLAKQIYACFGYDLPNAPYAQSEMECSQKYVVRSSSVAKKLEILASAPIGTLLHFDGHIMLFLGMNDGVPYCISSTGSIAVKNGESLDLLNTNTIMLNSLTDTLRIDGLTWLEHVDAILIP